MKFKNLSQKVHAQFNMLAEQRLFKMDVSKAEIWETYLESFPPGTNEIYKERREYDCQCCKQFVSNIGNVAAIIDGEIKSVWDIEIGGHFQVVVDALAEKVRSASIANIFLHTEPRFGQEKTVQTLESGETINWDHFHCELPEALVSPHHCQSLLGKSHTSMKVYRRGLEELSLESCEIVLDLINQGSLYKGDEFKSAVVEFQSYKAAFDVFDGNRDIFIWSTLDNRSALIRSTVIGTLLQDISEGVDINTAVGKFEAKVAPTNYKRSSAPITKSMVNKAMDKIEDLGLRGSLERRFATIEDISVNNVIFADRSASALMKDSLTDALMGEVRESKGNYESTDEISIEEFISNVIPNIDSMEVLVEGAHTNNLVSLVGPQHDEAEKLFQWDNQFSWSYVGNITDSIKDRVKRAGGNVEGVLRSSLSWFNTDDLDIHVKEPGDNLIYYGNKRSFSSGRLDVDMNAGGVAHSIDPVENIVWTEQSSMPVGNYQVFVNNYSQRNTSEGGFEIEIEFGGASKVFTYNKIVKHKSSVHVADIVNNGESFVIVNVNNDIEMVGRSKEIWGISTENFQKVNVMLHSPNFWDEQKSGNKHYMFMLDGCSTPDRMRGIYNEFLRSDLTEHRKVLEILADKTKCDHAENQLSGLGFSSTKRASLICKVKGNFTRTLKVNF